MELLLATALGLCVSAVLVWGGTFLYRLWRHERQRTLDERSTLALSKAYLKRLKIDVLKSYPMKDISSVESANSIKTFYHQFGDNVRVSYVPKYEQPYRVFLFNPKSKEWRYYASYKRYDNFIFDVNFFLVNPDQICFRHGKIIPLNREV